MNASDRCGVTAPFLSLARLSFAAGACAALLALSACSSSGGGGGGSKDEDDPPADETNPLMLVAWELTASDNYGDDGELLVARSTDGGETWSDPAVLNSNAGSDNGNDAAVNFATDSQGHWIAVWRSDLDGDLDVYAANSTDDGLTWSDPVPVNEDAESDVESDTNPDVVFDGQGHWIVAWESDDTGGATSYDILYAVSEDDGATWSAQDVLADADEYDGYVTLAAGSDGRVAALWEGQASEEPYFVYASVLDGVGGEWTAPNSIGYDSECPTCGSYGAHLETDGNGVWVAIWESDDDGETDIHFARSTDNGDTWSDPGVVLHSRFDVDGAGDDGATHHNSMATDGEGNWVVVWQSNSNMAEGQANDQNILFSRSTDNGASWSEPDHLNIDWESDAANDLVPTVTVDSSGLWTVVWYATRLNGGSDESDLFHAYSTDVGETWSDPGPLNANADSDGLTSADDEEDDLNPVLRAH